MESLPVTLIVKAPNQQIEDQKIRCETSWTINKLKEHLSEVYPSRPPRHEQKLIYSGQLLNDSVVLKDILRQYEGQDTHTVHLVCTPRHTKMNRAKQTAPVAENASTEARGMNSNSNTTNPSATGSASPESAPQSTLNTENRVPTFPNNGIPWNNGMPWMNFNGQMPHMELNQYQMQMALMQQAYIQYMTQYMQLASGQTPILTTPTTVPTQNPPINPTDGPQIQPEQPQGDALRPPAQPANENEERDWLDIFYLLSRAMVLFSVVYFYSSPVRFIFVLLLALALYLYQTGFFRNIHLNNNTISGTPNGAPQEEQAPTRFMVAWTFVTTFFASLIPEVPTINA